MEIQGYKRVPMSEKTPNVLHYQCDICSECLGLGEIKQHSQVHEINMLRHKYTARLSELIMNSTLPQGKPVREAMSICIQIIDEIFIKEFQMKINVKEK